MSEPSKILTREETRALVVRVANEGAGVIGPSVALLTHDEALRELVGELAEFLGNNVAGNCTSDCKLGADLRHALAHADRCQVGKLLARAKTVAQ